MSRNNNEKPNKIDNTNINNTRPKKHKRKKKSFFKKGLLIYVILLCIIGISVLSVLWSKLSSYQKNIDDNTNALEQEKLSKRAPQIFFEEKYNSMTDKDWINAYNNANPDSLNKDEDIKAYINSSIINADTSLWKAPEYTENSPVYLVKSNDAELARFYIAGTDNNLSISKIEINITGEYNGEITVPGSCSVTCNGKSLGESYSSEANSLSLDDYKDDLINPVTYKTYSVQGLLSEPEFNIEHTDNTFNIATDTNGDYYLVLADGDSYKTEAESFVKSLLYYYSQGKTSASANMAAAINHVASGSSAASIIRQSLDGVLWRYPTNTTYETSASDTYVIADNCYFVDIFYRDVNSESLDKQIYRVYFLDLGNGFKIYNFAMM